MNSFDIIVTGGGIIGTATALSLSRHSKLHILLIESEPDFAMHQTGHNSGVIHSGLYYKPGSLKAENCVKGRELIYNFCDTHKIDYERCGKIVVATDNQQIQSLNNLYERGVANGLTGIKKIGKEELKEYEPYVSGVAGLFVPQTGIVDYKKITEKYIELFKIQNGLVELNCEFLSAKETNTELIIKTTKGEFKTNILVNCGGLYSDIIAMRCGVDPGLQIIPFRGEYYKIKKDKKYLVKNLVYPVPDIKFPFLGVHFTRMISGDVEAGPNAVLAFKRKGYSKKDFSFSDFSRMIFFPGFIKMASRYYKMGAGEFYRSFNKKAFVKALQKLIPQISPDDIEPGGSGVRAQAVDRNGNLLDDFRIVETKRMVHVLNAPSPAATASLAIGEKIANVVKLKLNS